MIGTEPCRRPDKRRHATAAQARKHLAYLKRRGERGERGDNLSVYRCGDHWHVGSWRTWGGAL